MMTGNEIHALLGRQLQTVLALDGPPDLNARFDRDLHADSLDLVEVIEGMEADLAARGFTVHLDDDQLLAFETVGDAVAAVQALTGRDGA